MDEPEVTPEMRESFRKGAEITLGWAVRDRNILSLTISQPNRGPQTGSFRIRAGKLLPRGEGDIPYERVLAIFESNAYLVITWNRGGFRGMPYLYGGNEVIGVELGDEPT